MRDEHGFSTADLPLYFEWHGVSRGSQPPLLLVHGGGATIESNWGRLIPALADSRRMLAVELQGHGRTGSGDRAASFEASADGVAALLKELSPGPVDVLGFSNGGQVAMQLAIRHPAAVRRLVVASAPHRRDGMVDGFWDGLASITAPTLVVAADQDVIRPEHTLRLATLIPNARMMVVPGNHGDYLGELAAAAGDDGPLRRTLPFIVDFLDRPDSGSADSTPRMYCVRAEVIRWIDDEWPGWVQVHLTESDGTVATLTDKVPVFVSDDRLEPGTELPLAVEVPCDLLSWTGERSARIRLHFGLEDQNGRTTFTVDERVLVQRP